MPTSGSALPRIAEIRAVVFDLDGVLLDSEPLHFRAARRVFAERGKVLTEAEYRLWIGRGTSDTWTAWKAEYRFAEEVSELIARDEEARREEIRRGVDPIPEAAALARDLAARSLPLAIASSSTLETIDAELAAVGLSEIFPLRVSGEEVERGKPAPDIYLRAAERLGLPPRACLAIEDSPAGVRAASAAGLTCIAVPTPWTCDGDFSEADVTLLSLRYFPLLLL